MTTADNARKESAFIFYDMPKKDQPTVDPGYKDNAARMSMDHVTLTMIGTAAKHAFNGEGPDKMEVFDAEGNLRNPEFKHFNYDIEGFRVAVPVSMLRKILEPMTSDWVMLKIRTDYPLAAVGMIGDEYCAAYIAPRIDEDF